MSLPPLPEILIESLVRNALLEDLGRSGDITTDSIVPVNKKWKAALVARKKGVIAGLDLAWIAFRLIDPSIKFQIKHSDGETVDAKTTIATVQGSGRAIVTAERVALNFLCHLSGVATATNTFVELVKSYKARIVCTRKTTPGLRAVEKYAVRAGGGMNHRFGLDDAVLIKDNHIAACGSLRKAVMLAKQSVGPFVKIELEVDTLDQLRDALDLPVDAVLLDNMSPALMEKAVKMVNGKFLLEASGGITLETAQAVAASGVDIISVGWVTHSAPILDIGLDDL